MLELLLETYENAISGRFLNEIPELDAQEKIIQETLEQLHKSLSPEQNELLGTLNRASAIHEQLVGMACFLVGVNGIY